MMSFQNTNETNPYVEISDVAKYFSVSTATVRTWVRKEYIPRSAYIKAGETYRYNIASIEAHLTENEERRKLHGE